MDGLTGSTLSHYRILERIGSGGMGVVYLGVDQRLDRQVAVKVLPAGALVDEAARRNFRKEALLVSRLNHPNIATVHDFDSQEGVDFLVMEYIPGVTMQEKLAGGALAEKEILALAPQIAQGLAAAHEQGVIHCDLKPGNLRVTPDGRVKILDFGLARRLYPAADLRVRDTLTSTTSTAGTMPYMSPEQLRGDRVDARCDIYGCGVVLYEMATGQRPFAETWGPKLIDAILNQAPLAPTALNRRIAPALENIILKAMEKDSDRRYQSTRELLVDLTRLSGPVPLVAPARPARSRRRWALAAALAVVAALLVALEMSGWRRRLLEGSGAGRVEALAVLPLENLLGDPSKDYLADGMTEALIANLAKIKTLRVTSRTSVLQYKGARRPLPEIARELDVDAVVEGSVLHTENRVRITAQLIHVATDRHLWAESYDRDLRDVLGIQSEVAGMIAHEIEAKLDPRAGGRPPGQRRPADPLAYEAYLRGRSHRDRPTLESLRKSIESLALAIEFEPASAPAHAALAESYMLLVAYGGLPGKDAYSKAKAEVTKALQLDERLSEAHAALAQLRFLLDWNWPGAEEAFRRALELDADNAAAHRAFASYLAAMGRAEEALAEIQRAQDLEPLSVLNSVDAGRIHVALRQPDRAIAQLRNVLDTDPDYPVAHEILGWAYLGKGNSDDAIKEFKAATALPGNSWTMVMGLGYAYAASGQRAQAEQILEQLKDLSTRRHVSAVGIATLYAGLGAKEPALEWLERACAAREAALVLIDGQVAFDGLRADPRFQELLRCVGLPRRSALDART